MLRYVVAGAVGLGMGIMAWEFLGKDVMRYIRIHNM
jgi:hypothetical protein